MPPHPVYIVDDDLDMCRSLAILLTIEGRSATAYQSAASFFDELGQLPTGIVISDVCMPEIDGLQMLHELRIRERRDPVIFMTGHGDIALAVKAIRRGAHDFIEKPFSRDVLIGAVDEACHSLSADRYDDVSVRINRLSKREREVLEALMAGATNKRIALDLGISPRTVEIHRAHLMDKMGATSLSSLVRMGWEARVDRLAPVDDLAAAADQRPSPPVPNGAIEI